MIEKKLGEMINIYDSKRIPLSSKQRLEKQGDYPYYGATGQIDSVDDFIFDGEYILLAEDGSVKTVDNKPIVFKAKGKFWANNHVHVFDVKEGYDLDYVYYYLKTINIDKYITGSVQLKINQQNLNSIPIKIPNLKKQKEVASILSSLDDKIELNNKINQNLEELAQTLYHQWFISFEFPDKDGKLYKSNGGKMVESELGTIPKGWEVASLSEILDVKTGKKDANIRTENGKYKFFTCSKEGFYTDNYSFDTKAILIAGNGAFYVDWYRGKFEAYQRNYVLEPNNDDLFFFLYMFLKEKIKYFTLSSKGSIVKFITKDMLDNLKFPLPSHTKMNEFSSKINPIFDMIENNKKENDNLFELRDSLLPFLMNGKVTIK